MCFKLRIMCASNEAKGIKKAKQKARVRIVFSELIAIIENDHSKIDLVFHQSIKTQKHFVALLFKVFHSSTSFIYMDLINFIFYTKYKTSKILFKQSIFKKP